MNNNISIYSNKSVYRRKTNTSLLNTLSKNITDLQSKKITSDFRARSIIKELDKRPTTSDQLIQFKRLKVRFSWI